jgi:hypothetical protein
MAKRHFGSSYKQQLLLTNIRLRSTTGWGLAIEVLEADFEIGHVEFKHPMSYLQVKEAYVERSSSTTSLNITSHNSPANGSMKSKNSVEPADVPKELNISETVGIGHVEFKHPISVKRSASDRFNICNCNYLKVTNPAGKPH